MPQFSIYHNPRCSKSRQTLAILEEHNIQPDIILYLENTPNKKKIQELLQQLGKKPRDINLSDDALLTAMLAEPRLIERPIVVSNNNAVLGRPPENVLELIK